MLQSVVAAVPLIALEAVACDTETTGLNTRKAGIVHFGAVGIAQGVVCPRHTFEIRLDPVVPIPPRR